MLKHYLKITFRNLRKYKTQSLTGIFGLAFGVACFVPALYWMRYETSYDSFYPDAAHIYRVYAVEKQSGKEKELVPGILKRKLHDYFPAIEASTSWVFNFQQWDYLTDETPYISLRSMFTDSTFFNVFQQTVISGDVRNPLQIANSIVLTETVAVRLFGDVEKAIGQQLKSAMYAHVPSVTVTAVIKDPPPNTNIPFEALHYWREILSGLDVLPEVEQWTYFEQEMYVKFHPHADVAALAAQFRDFTTQIEANTNIEVRMMPISDVRHRFNADLPFALNFIRLFVAAGLLLLFSAFFNFLNLHLDFFRQRIDELRQRAVVGAKSWQLIMQMMFELMLAIILSLSLACCFLVLVRPAFSGLLDITVGMSQSLYLFAVCGICMMTLMLFIGSFPFWRLSRIAMRHLAKGKPTGQPLMRRMAVSLQLVVSIVFIVAALVVMMQMRFTNRKDLGFDSSGLIQISGPLMPMFMHGKVISSELATIPQIVKISSTTFTPQHTVPSQYMRTNVEWNGKPANINPAFRLIDADNRFAETFGLKMFMGKWLDEGAQQKVVLNEEAARVMGLSEPVGAMIRFSNDVSESSAPMQEYEVVGVVNDFHTLSLRSPIYPTIFIANPQPVWYVIRTVPGQEQEAMRRIAEILPGINPSLADVRLTPFNELYDRLNHSEQVGLKMFSVMATVCLLISLFGIYAVAHAATQRRRKEIAIRKVYGASVWDIVRMFFREYTLQVAFAAAIALPLACLAMSRWLQGYAYRTNISSWLLIGVVIAVVAIVLLTVLGQVLKAANDNPAKVVKSE